MADFGNFCLLLALCLSLYALIASLTGASLARRRVVWSGERAALAASAAALLAFGALLYLMLADDFATSHVANNSSRSLPVLYKISAIWGGHDGSMLLWVFFTALLSGLVIARNRRRHRDMMPWVVAVLMVNLAFFLALNLFLSNPFDQLVRISPDGATAPFVPADGRGLNPLLQYWAMVIHPPILYVGFIGFVVPFAFAVAALVTRQQGNAWVRIVRRWTLVVWLLLGIGIILGGKWAYVVLGWGGYWGWDPVENASLMPWLVSTAFLHSIVVQERRGMLKVWNVILVLLTYLLGIFGTFLTRSGIVNSVHAFADSNLGRFFVYYMAFVLAGTLLLLADRQPYLRSERRLDSMISRESAFLFNNLVLVAACFAVFWGTMFPALSEWIRGTKISVGPLFFDRINVPIGLLLLLLTGIGPLLAWRRASPAALGRAFLWPGVAAALALAGLLAGGLRNFYVTVCLTLCAFVLATIVQEFAEGARVRMRQHGERFPEALGRLVLRNTRRYGGYVVHLGVVLMFVGFAGNAFNREATLHLQTGETGRVGDYALTLADFHQGREALYEYGRAVIEVTRDGRPAGTLTAEKRIFDSGGQTTTTVGLRSTPKEDLYVVFTGITGDAFEIKAHVNPLVFWLWLGSGILVLGTLLTLLNSKRGGRPGEAVR